MTETLQERITRHEGTRLTLYDDATGLPLKKGDTIKGNPTIGTGRCLSTKGISTGENFLLLANDIADCWASIDGNVAFTWVSNLSQIRQEVIIEMIFEMGLEGLCEFKQMIADIKAADYVNAAKEMLNSHWAMEAPERCRELAQMMLTGEAN